MANIVTDSSFQEEVINNEGVVLVDFWAEWCGPCKVMLPLVEELATELEGQVKICKIDVDSNSESAQAYRVMSIPTLLIFKDWKVVDQMVWVQDKEELKAKLLSHTA